MDQDRSPRPTPPEPGSRRGRPARRRPDATPSVIDVLVVVVVIVSVVVLLLAGFSGEASVAWVSAAGACGVGIVRRLRPRG